MGALVPDFYAVHDPFSAVAQDNAARDRLGRILPPCVVMRRAESLEEWSRRAAADVFQAAAVRSDRHQAHGPRAHACLTHMHKTTTHTTRRGVACSQSGWSRRLARPPVRGPMQVCMRMHAARTRDDRPTGCWRVGPLPCCIDAFRTTP